MQFIRVTAEIHVAEMLNRWLISQRWVLLLVWYWGETDGQKWCRDNSSENSSGMISWFERQHWTSSGVWCSYFSVYHKELPLQRNRVGSVCLLWAPPWKEKQVLSHSSSGGEGSLPKSAANCMFYWWQKLECYIHIPMLRAKKWLIVTWLKCESVFT